MLSLCGIKLCVLNRGFAVSSHIVLWAKVSGVSWRMQMFEHAWIYGGIMVAIGCLPPPPRLLCFLFCEGGWHKGRSGSVSGGDGLCQGRLVWSGA